MPQFASREEYLAWKASQQAVAGVSAGGAARVEQTPARPAEGRADRRKQGLKETFSDLPGWSWLFVAACFAIPILSLGGAIPGALGFGAAAGCASIAKRPAWETSTRVVVCAAITGGAWLAFLGFAVGVASFRK
jgi:hypothetical protein